MIEGIVKSEEEIAEAEVVVAVLFAATVFRDAHPLEPNPAVAHQHGAVKPSWFIVTTGTP